MSATPAPSTSSRGLNAILWQLLGSSGRAVATFLFGVLLARLLGPAPFATVAVAMSFIGLAGLIADFGLTVALIQRRELNDEIIGFVFSLQMVIALALTAVFAVIAPLLASFFNLTAWEPLAALSLIFVLQALGQASAALLRRDLRFKALNVVQLLAYVIGYAGVGILLALRGAGVWALVAAQLTQALVASATYLFLIRPKLRLTLRSPDAALLRFSRTAAVTNMVSWAIGNLPTLLIGRAFGPVPLALYNRAAMTVGVPMNNIVSVLQTVLLSLYSRGQDRPEYLGRVYGGALGVVSVLLFPAFVTLAVLAWPLAELLFGQKWVGIEPLIALLAVAMPFDAVACITSPLLVGVGQPQRDFRGQFRTLLLGGALTASVAWMFQPPLAVLTLTVAVCIYVLRSIMLVHQATQVVSLPFAALARRGLYCVAVTVLSAVMAFSMSSAFAGWSAGVQFVGGALAGVLAWLGFIALTKRRWMLDEDVMTVARPLLTRLPLGKRFLKVP